MSDGTLQDAWRAAVDKVLKGAAFDTLVARSRDGIPIGPLYAKADGAEPLLWRGDAGRVLTLPRIEAGDPGQAVDTAQTELAGGADGLTLAASRDPATADPWTPEELGTLLRELRTDRLVVRLDLRLQDPSAIEARAAALKRAGAVLSQIDLGFDPLGAMARSGAVASANKEAAAVMRALRDGGFAACLRADGRPYHEAGGTEAQELAAVLATAVTYLRVCEDFGLEAARDAIGFTLAADADQLLGLAKFRALRRLWARIERACGLAPKPIRLHAETAWRMLARSDPATNLLRNTVATTTAILAGADSLTVLPHTGALGPPDAAANRLARNTAIVLLQEAQLGRVSDPATGSGALEAITDALCLSAWALFQCLEQQGGLIRALQAGTWQAKIARARAERRNDLVAGDGVLVGVTRFLPPGEAATTASDARMQGPGGAMLPSVRDAAAFENAS